MSKYINPLQGIDQDIADLRIAESDEPSIYYPQRIGVFGRFGRINGDDAVKVLLDLIKQLDKRIDELEATNGK